MGVLSRRGAGIPLRTRVGDVAAVSVVRGPSTGRHLGRRGRRLGGRRPHGGVGVLEVRVLGGLGVRAAGEAVDVPIRRALAVVAYLGVEGPSPRERLAELFWGDLGEERARANLRMALHKLRPTALAAHLEAGAHEVRLCGEVQVDLLEFRACLARGDVPGALSRFGGPFLHGVDLPGSEAWEAWVGAGRESVRAAHHGALAAQAAALEAAGDLRGALAVRLDLLAADELEEVHHREVMRLHYLLGDRGAALRAFLRCRDLLRGELGLAPLEATLSLARLVESGGALPGGPARPGLPVSVLRPPELIGRGGAWVQLEAAWASGRAAVLSGEPGIGKSRLAADFARAYGRSVLSAGRPGDEVVPYATLTRALRALLAEAPGLALPPGVRGELARLLPEWGETPAPLRSPQDRTRFLEAVGAAYRAALEAGVRAVVVDDVQFADEASVEALLYAHGPHLGGPDPALRVLYAHRPGALGPATRLALTRAVDAGLAAEVALGPLGEAQVGALVRSLALPGPHAEGLAALEGDLTRFAAGNPQWVLETVRNLLESDAPRDPAALETLRSGALSHLLTRRLDRLSPGARRLSRVLAVAGVDVDLAARVLDLDVLALLGPLGELERAQIVAGGGFTHDLVYEAALADVPTALHVALHKRCALHLGELGADPGRVARHWSGAGDPLRAAPQWEAAARAAEEKYRHAEGAELHLRASEAYAAAGERRQEFQALKRHADLLRTYDQGPRYAAVVERLLEGANTPYLRAGAWQSKADLLSRQGHGPEAEQAARAGYEQAQLSGDLRQRTTLLNMVAVTLWQQRRLDEAARAFEETLALCREWGEARFEADTWVNLGVVQADGQRYAEAFSSYDRALGLYRDLGEEVGQAHVYTNHGAALRECGSAREALPRLQAALELYRAGQPLPDYERRVLTQLAEARRDLGEFGEALAAIDEAAAIVARSGLPAGRVREVRGEVLLWLGALEEAGEELRAALDLSRPGDGRGRVALKLAWHARWSGEEAGGEALRLAQADLRDTRDAALRVQLALFGGVTRPAAQGVQRLASALERASTSGLAGLEVRVRAHLALKLLEAGEVGAALAQALRALDLSTRVSPTGGALAEVRLAHVLALRAAGHPDAVQEQAALSSWLLAEAGRHVPEARRPDFLRGNPVCRAALFGEDVVSP